MELDLVDRQDRSNIPAEYKPAVNPEIENRWPAPDEEMDAVELRGSISKIGDVVPYPGPKPNLRGKIDEYLGTPKGSSINKDNITPLPILRPPKDK